MVVIPAWGGGEGGSGVKVRKKSREELGVGWGGGGCQLKDWVGTLAMEMVCCSMASWMATLSSSLIWSTTQDTDTEMFHTAAATQSTNQGG